MALREGAALAVLPGQRHRVAIDQQRAEAERLRRRPVDAFAGLDRLGAGVEEALHGAMHVEILWHRGDLLADLTQRIERDAGVAAARVVMVARRLDLGPAAVEPVGAIGAVALARFELGVEAGAPGPPPLLYPAPSGGALRPPPLFVDFLL